MDNPPFVVGVRFAKVGKIYHFDAHKAADVKVGEWVVVETSRGWQLGEVAQLVTDAPLPPEGTWKQIERKATPRDLLLRQSWQSKEGEVLESCKVRAQELRLNMIKVISAEFSLDGARLTILFCSDSDDKVEVKSLRQDMQKQWSPAQVDLRQIGPRDAAKVFCGMGACGLESRCCSRFLMDFSSISIKMAKEQGISLTPTEITGMCGRLRCCLIYEYETYTKARALLPKRNKRVRTPNGEGKVVDVIPLRNAVLVDLPELGVREFSRDDIVLVDENAPAEKAPEAAAPAASDAAPVEKDATESQPEVKAAAVEAPKPQTRERERRPNNRPPKNNRPDRRRRE